MDIDTFRSASNALVDSLTHAQQSLYAANRFHSARGVVDALQKLANSMAIATWPPIFEDLLVLAAAELPKRSIGGHTFSHAHQEATWRCLEVLEAGWQTLGNDTVYGDATGSVDRLDEQVASEIALLFRRYGSMDKLLVANRSEDKLEMLTLLNDFQKSCKPHWEYPFDVSELINDIKLERALAPSSESVAEQIESASSKQTGAKRSTTKGKSNGDTKAEMASNLEEVEEPLALSENKQDILKALFEEKAFDSDKRISAIGITIAVAGDTADVNAFKEPLADLVRSCFLLSKTGRGGGYWLTQDGMDRAKKQ